MSRDEWVQERQDLLELEKVSTRLRDEVTKRRQLVVRHFMFEPERWPARASTPAGWT